ncbi:NAD(P)/FAD-dependent oxidoreductase [Aureimonas phyllosphaerae]|uniref:Glycine/D-amino acid oxidase-like deaminating enzyme n=1 Tax=Aureimonas phyllosphaerae TaxID=1166078 RepID=A0A7W6BZW5_9HYPH|nr:FAD-binding oxidoreductase [Aureimonas phyllosphaerae]MBB3938263.1 glycine/D-amino acid oxidase-like deaminating enzyme [Aureimonas phyllosphaerae]MBB3962270.1 glycine/D-amino acid oxidase-like deaminating enzyme [Aureimonas phyllosphaerae]SFF59054.1 hypothetical protein SAMN05216566_1408 [Aureimonas phyllosphaerae]
MSYIDTFYKRTLTSEAAFARLDRDLECDVCIVGGGLAGLTAALELSRRGRSVVLLEAERIGWGASGRNGGFVSPGYANGRDVIVSVVGEEVADELHRMSIEGMRMVADNIAVLQLDGVRPEPGIIGALRYDGEAELHRTRDRLEKRFGYSTDVLSRPELQERLVSPRYFQGLLDPNAFHIHPLEYALGLAREIERLGGTVCEKSAVVATELEAPEKRVRTSEASVRARDVVFCGGGYTRQMLPALQRSFLPIATYVLLTEDAPEVIAKAIRTRAAIGDNRRAGDYYRLVDDGRRILWGGKITTRRSEPRELGKLLRQSMVSTYPQLHDLRVELAWSGLMSYARHKMPQIGQWRPHVWYCTAFGGHGLNTTAIGGRVVAEAIAGETRRIDAFRPFGLDWTGGPLGMLAVQLTYWSLQASDWWRERKAA